MTAVHRIVVGVHGSLGSLQALRYAADEARDRGAPLAPVIAWIPPGGDMAERRSPSPYLRRVWRDAAQERLDTAFDDGLGGLPADLRVEPMVVRGDTGPVLAAVCAAEDLLVIGPRRRSPVGRALHKSAGRYLLAHAPCPVVIVPPSELMEEELGHGPWHLLRRHSIAPLEHPAP